MPDPDAVAAALARLVNGTSAPRRFTPGTTRRLSTERIVEEGEAALEDLPTAASFVAADGEQRLRRAIDGPVDSALEARGRKVLSALRRLREAAGSERLAPTGEDRETDADHFRRGRTTLLKGDGVATER